LGRAEGLRGRAACVGDAAGESDSSGAWDWGPRVVSTVWHPGPVLDLEIESREEAGAVVGLWVDGWFLGEWVPDASRRLSLGASEWGGSAGAELVLRVRESEGAWGAPWRSLVPDSMGWLSFLPEATADEASGPGVEVALTSLVHSPWLANPSLDISWAHHPLQADAAGLVFELPPSSSGRCEAMLGARNQLWWMEVGRGLDVYF
jgi:hypothetical protein